MEGGGAGAPWPEWIQLMERLSQQRYFDLEQAGGADEASMAAVVFMDLSEVNEKAGFDILKYVCSFLLRCCCWRTPSPSWCCSWWPDGSGRRRWPYSTSGAAEEEDWRDLNILRQEYG